MSDPDQVIAHVDLLRALDRLLAQADTVREKREAFNRALAANVAEQSKAEAATESEGER